uniref:Uncharacterized protein AlNc14C296G10304 n=1 Tax=Albugo laibachii Nc14 TaxID=890382 RepID=F0WVG9_9STRA|nr:conserved hypothetical protein [Albugo laibachii Nc14]|eukprot:CCA25410.1 conserved hypothetical protein [Albugo laibachii Nc14]
MDKIVSLRLGHIRTSVCDTRPLVISQSPQKEPLCSLCMLSASRYTCPKCSVRYCSVSCYQKHNISCTESFARAHIAAELKAEDDTEKKKSFDAILQRTKEFQNEQNRWNAMDEEISESFDNLQLKLEENGEIQFEDLTDAQKEEFLRAVRKGEVSKWIHCWEPWWMMSPATYLEETQRQRYPRIQQVEDDIPREGGHEELAESQRFPTVLFTENESREMPDLMSSLIRGHGKPSEFLKYHLIDIMHAYSLVMRRYNGEWRSTPLDAAEDIYAICTSFNDTKVRFSSMEQTLSAISIKAIEILRDAKEGQSRMADVFSILSWKVFILDALCDLKALFLAAKSDSFFVASSTTRAKHSKKVQAKLTLAGRKASFFLCWAFHTAEEDLHNLCQELKAQLEASLTQ